MFHGPESMLFFRIDFVLHGVMVGWNIISLRFTFQKDLIHAHQHYDADLIHSRPKCYQEQGIRQRI